MIKEHERVVLKSPISGEGLVDLEHLLTPHVS
jgi:hypothetical protein